MGKSKLVAAVHTQAEMLIEEFKKQAGKAARIPHAVNVAVVNIVWQMVGSKWHPEYVKLYCNRNEVREGNFWQGFSE